MNDSKLLVYKLYSHFFQRGFAFGSLCCITSRKRKVNLGKTVSTSIKSRLKSAKNQKLKNVVLFIPDNFSLEDIYSTFENWSHGRLNITWIYKNKIYNTNLK